MMSNKGGNGITSRLVNIIDVIFIDTLVIIEACANGHKDVVELLVEKKSKCKFS